MFKLAESKEVMDDNIANKRSKSLVIPTGKTTDHMALKFFPEDYPYIKSGVFWRNFKLD